MTVVLIEDDNGLAAAASEALVASRLRVEWRKDFETAYDLAVDPMTDLIVLARTLPDGDGVDFLRQLRSAGITTAVLMISARTAIPDRVAALEAGADDYLVKPFAFDEFVARCRALLRRPRAFEREPIRFGALVLRPDTLELAVHNTPLAIARREGQLLVALLRRQGRVCTRAYLEGALYDPSIAVSPNAIETSISRLRSLLVGVNAGVDLKTVRGVGYALVEA
ncbi:MAG: response regulator transcription factor [Hyphomonadaceae bacterium]